MSSYSPTITSDVIFAGSSDSGACMFNKEY
jgi:hypothetical protein